MANSKVTSLLNDLVEICKDGQEGFRQAAEAIQDSDLKALFMQYSEQRAQFASELQTEVMHSGGKPEQSGSAAGSLHRGWINLKSAITGKNEGAIISECERGEDAAKDAYTKAVNESLPEPVSSLIQRQFGQVQAAHDRIRALEVAHQR